MMTPLPPAYDRSYYPRELVIDHGDFSFGLVAGVRDALLAQRRVHCDQGRVLRKTAQPGDHPVHLRLSIHDDLFLRR